MSQTTIAPARLRPVIALVAAALAIVLVVAGGSRVELIRMGSVATSAPSAPG